uniref:Serine hydrolase like 2 n=1 Tax=Lepisosteus oculatus TaxID=7918 RepID=W5N251_LEPOC|nr:PREDICTED: serine hydrolase-like protein 2 [Lepisosteus oculatus]
MNTLMDACVLLSVCLSNPQLVGGMLQAVRRLSTSVSSMKHAVPCREVQFPVPWGHIAAKDWGPRDGRPVLCLHGWSDNAGSFDRLIPLLPADCRCVAIDFPGHGLSTHRPAGVLYTFPAYVADMRRVIEGQALPALLSQ